MFKSGRRLKPPARRDIQLKGDLVQKVEVHYSDDGITHKFARPLLSCQRPQAQYTGHSMMSVSLDHYVKAFAQNGPKSRV
jgi:hypothetical protein